MSELPSSFFGWELRSLSVIFREALMPYFLHLCAINAWWSLDIYGLYYLHRGGCINHTDTRTQDIKKPPVHTCSCCYYRNPHTDTYIQKTNSVDTYRLCHKMCHDSTCTRWPCKHRLAQWTAVSSSKDKRTTSLYSPVSAACILLSHDWRTATWSTVVSK